MSTNALQIARSCSTCHVLSLFECDYVFMTWFEAYLPDAARFSRLHRLAAGLNLRDALSMRRPQLEVPRDAWPQRAGDRPTALPRCVHFYGAASPESVEMTFRPSRRQRRQKCD